MENIDSWDAFGSKYLKSEDVASDKDKYVIVAVDSKAEEGKNTVIFTLERNGFEKLFGCNATNEQAVKVNCPKSPRQAIGKVVTFNKVRTTNPRTQQEVDGLRIQFVVEPVEEPKETDTTESGIKEDATM